MHFPFRWMLWSSLSALSACGPTRMAVKPVSPPVSQPSATARPAVARRSEPAPIDREVAMLPGVGALWLIGADGERTYVLEAGVRDSALPPLVMVHGLGARGVLDFYPILPELTRTRRIIAIDLPGLGRSELAEADPSPVHFAEIVSDVIATRVDGPFDLVGHSLGGVVALLSAAAHKERVQHLALIDVAGVLHREAFVGSKLNVSLAEVHRLSPRAGQVLQGAGKALVSALRNFEPDEQQLTLGSRTVTGSSARAAIALIQMDVGPKLDQIAAPTLLIWGELDPVAPLRTARMLEDRIGNAELAVLDGVGHVPMAERPEQMAKLLTAFLDAPRLRTASAPAPLAPARDYECRKQNDLVLRGSYRNMILRNCHRVQLEGVMAEHLELEGSDAELVQSRITRGVHATHSDLVLTGGILEGDVALLLDESRVDAAGTRLHGRRAAVQAIDDSRVLFSAVDVQSPFAHGSLHGHRGFEDGEGF